MTEKNMRDFNDTGSLAGAIDFHLANTVGKTPDAASTTDWRLALSRAVRDKLIDPWFEATRRTYAQDNKRVYYLSMEFLLGRILQDAVNNLGLEDAARSALASHGVDFADVVCDEPDAALGNGGLGRLAACFLDSLSCLGIPAYGYGIRYAHGLFQQSFEDGRQVEMAEGWLRQQHNWEFERAECLYDIGFGGEVNETGGNAIWTPTDVVSAQAYDTPVPGWRAGWTNTLRLWSAKPKKIFDLEPFNRGEYMEAAAPEVLAETISRVLYPDDSTEIGKALRLKQEYFFTAASLQDLLRRFLTHNGDLRALPSKVAIQMNDTHPAIAGPELIRLLIDTHGFDFDDAFGIAQGTLNYTNHTLLPEALEAWDTRLMADTLPRHMQLIERIDARLSKDAAAAKATARIVEDNKVNMGTLAFACANRVNGVSALHTDLMKQTVFSDLHQVYPERILNQTNGVTPRRWLHGCNRGLRDLLNETIGTDWVCDLEQLEKIAPLADDADFRARFMQVKQDNKQMLTSWVKDRMGIEISPDAMFDVQIKRIHEYKRQLMNALETAALANAIRRDPDADWTPRVKIFGGKAAPAYLDAKNIIRLINDIAVSINSDPVIGDRLKVLYPPNYNVSMAEILIPATDLSEQISTAGKEASGTGNMKFALNGAVTVGTLDGANVEIRDHVGDDNIYIFGMTAEEVEAARAGYDTQAYIDQSPILKEVIDQIREGVYSPGEPTRHWPVLEKLLRDDYFMVAADFDAYWAAQRQVDKGFADKDAWARMAVLNTAHSGWFSSDRTIQGYADAIWGVASLAGESK
ncbi:glycogen/starch/alpha-glucan phosphorylase [Alisedimentitalea sp. MJ-SS2]|uniref:glycogen/starch/alpha-glucan phosphorylase n=1 Tax=Aliisedimentitalea sp. MJ-SS2 TaxID=3049795 RepID=UPI00290A4463|nr:glycogen/starch/alpha-glucan phosphorylase [Alisedimentitalea sp. MJ-SS2]MDU8928617.1 glycogen/starch/alpha-glucan phosphorylase [Alisedimentitalea sp. MJ-SS2]